MLLNSGVEMLLFLRKTDTIDFYTVHNLPVQFLYVVMGLTEIYIMDLFSLLPLFSFKLKNVKCLKGYFGLLYV